MVKKQELVEAVALKMNVTKKDALEIVNTVTEIVADAIVKDGEAVLPNVGKFVVKERNCRVPQTGEPIVVKTVQFRCGSVVKNRVKE